MTEAHRFVDSTEAVHVGRERMSEAVASFGTTCATSAANGLRVETHAAWLAVVRGKRVAEWRVYADNEPARAAMRH